MKEKVAIITAAVCLTDPLPISGQKLSATQFPSLLTF